jgi:hypothetical protein
MPSSGWIVAKPKVTIRRYLAVGPSSGQKRVRLDPIGFAIYYGLKLSRAER